MEAFARPSKEDTNVSAAKDITAKTASTQATLAIPILAKTAVTAVRQKLETMSAIARQGCQESTARLTL